MSEGDRHVRWERDERTRQGAKQAEVWPRCASVGKKAEAGGSARGPPPRGAAVLTQPRQKKQHAFPRARARPRRGPSKKKPGLPSTNKKNRKKRKMPVAGREPGARHRAHMRWAERRANDGNLASAIARARVRRPRARLRCPRTELTRDRKVQVPGFQADQRRQLNKRGFGSHVPRPRGWGYSGPVFEERGV